MFCEKCGARVDDGQPFCPNCGNRMGAPAPAAPGFKPARPARPIAAKGGMDLGKMLMLIGIGLLVLTLVLTLFKGGATITHNVRNADGNGTHNETTFTRIDNFENRIILMSAVMFLLFSLFGVFKNRMLGMILACSAAFLFFFNVLRVALAIGDNNQTPATEGAQYTTSALSVWGWFTLIFALGAVAVCILAALSEMKNNK